ncbi:MAG: hypothetical protein ABI224_05575 [Acetobacteraceae bacterium]
MIPTLRAALASGALLPASLAMVLLIGLLGALAWGPIRRESRLRHQLEEVRDLYAPIAGTGLAPALSHGWRESSPASGIC